MTKNEKKSPEILILKEELRKPVVIVGMMGSGKTRIGGRLATALGLDFVDTDRLIEDRAGRSINEIFAIDGEAKFRDVERKIIMELLQGGACIIATGGGMVMGDGVMDAIKERAISVWLRSDVVEILKRIKNAQDRPLLKGGDPEKALRDLAAKREPVYSRADITVDSAQSAPGDTVSAVIKELCGFLKGGNF